MKFLFYLIILFLTKNVSAQNVTVEKVDNTTLNSVLGNIESLSIKETNDFAVRIFMVADSSGSAKTLGSDEITHHFLISISEYGEDPSSTLFTVGHFYKPTIIKEGKIPNGYFLEIQYGPGGNRLKKKIEITINAVQLD